VRESRSCWCTAVTSRPPLRRSWKNRHSRIGFSLFGITGVGSPAVPTPMLRLALCSRRRTAVCSCCTSAYSARTELGTPMNVDVALRHSSPAYASKAVRDSVSQTLISALATTAGITPRRYSLRRWPEQLTASRSGCIETERRSAHGDRRRETGPHETA
jgi:hypothetical protein